MRFKIAILFLLTACVSYGYSQCYKDIQRLFEVYKQSVVQFDEGKDVFNMTFKQTTSFNDGEELKFVNSEVNVVSDGIIKYMEVNGTRVCTDLNYQILIDDQKKSITLGMAVTNPVSLEENFSFLDSLMEKGSVVTCGSNDSETDEMVYRITAKKINKLKGVQRITIVLSNDLKSMRSYKVDYGVDDPVKTIEMTFKNLDFQCEECFLPISVESIVFEKNGNLKEEFKEYSLVDLR
jgi:hypothetical protein